MTFLITADLHLNKLPRDKYRHDWQKQLRTLVRNQHVEAVFLLGDFTDEKDYHSATLVNQVVDHIYELAKLCPVVCLKGNHDYTSLADAPFFAFLKRVEGVSWVGVPTPALDLKNVSAASLARLARVLLLPHSPNPARDWGASVDLRPYDWVFAHNTFEGATVGGRKLGGAPANLFSNGTKVISGDVHVPQTFGQITYVGAPYLVDFGDDYDPRVVTLDERGKFRSIECTGPQKRLIKVKAQQVLGLLPTNIKANPGDILKVQVELDAGQYARWAELKNSVHAWGQENKFVIHLVQPVLKGSVTKKAAPRTAPKSDTDLLKSYMKAQKVDDRTARIGLELLKLA